MDKRWIQYLYEFHMTRDYYACHDYLEEMWFEYGNPQNHLLMAFIQLAVALYHYRADNLRGARLLIDKAATIFELNNDQIEGYGINQEHLFIVLNDIKRDLAHHRIFKDVNLTFKDLKLKEQIEMMAYSQHLPIYPSSDLNNLHLVFKHRFKHRSF